MSGEFEKYAVYWVPKHADALARFGVSWTGWCAEHGEHRPRGEFPCVTAAVPAITRRLWRHGFHAIIKAPFRLQDGSSRFSLEHALEQVIEESVAFRLPRLELAVIGGSVAALVPHRVCAPLDTLVTRVGEAMAPLEMAAPVNGFAEAPAANGITNGVTNGVTGEETEPLVQLPATDTHRFHIPLTDRLPLEVAFRVMEELQPLMAPMMGETRRLRDVALMGDPGGGRPLRVLERYNLRGVLRQRGADSLPCHGPHVLAPMLDDPMTGTDLAI